MLMCVCVCVGSFRVKPRLVTITTVLNMIRMSYGAWKTHLRQASAEVQARIEGGENSEKLEDTLNAMATLTLLMEFAIPTVHDYFCYLKVRNSNTVTVCIHVCLLVCVSLCLSQCLSVRL